MPPPTRLNAFSYATDFDAVQARVFPALLDALSPIFRLDHCAFGISAHRVGTARWAFYRQLRCNLTYTIELSYLGYDKGGELRQFTMDDLHRFADDLLRAAFLYWEGDTSTGTQYQYRVGRAQVTQHIAANLAAYEAMNCDDESESDRPDSPDAEEDEPE